jgi:tetratricopeptide (TPR) repeat protein
VKRDYGAAWRGKGEVLNALGRGDEALECFDRADELGGE